MQKVPCLLAKLASAGYRVRSPRPDFLLNSAREHTRYPGSFCEHGMYHVSGSLSNIPNLKIGKKLLTSQGAKVRSF